MKQLLQHFYQEIQNENVSKEELQSIFTELENAYLKISEEEGYDPGFKDEMTKGLEEHQAKRLNELEEKAKHTATISHIQEQTKLITNAIRQFWRKEGFNYVEDIQITKAGSVVVKFGFSLSSYASYTNQPVTEAKEKQAKKEALKHQGYCLDQKDTNLLDCDSNKKLIQAFIINRFPSASITSWETFANVNSKQREQILRKLKIRIRDINDILSIEKAPV